LTFRVLVLVFAMLAMIVMGEQRLSRGESDARDHYGSFVVAPPPPPIGNQR
jgi:hypothetical protein